LVFTNLIETDQVDGRLADVGASVFRWLTSGRALQLPGEPFL
jgi:hypothetical protein